MHYRLKSLSLATATLLLSLTSPLLPLTLKFEPLVVQAQTTQDRKAEALRLNKEDIGEVYRNLGQYPKALEFYQQALAIPRNWRQGGGRDYLNNIGGLGVYKL
jgi:tetratricopeptide (TPR) repeat protein